MLQALWRKERDLPIGIHCSPRGKCRKLGCRLDPDSAKQGHNFLTPEIAKLAYCESVYREIGALIEQERLWGNMLSSQPLGFNLFDGLKLDIEKANRFFRHLFPDYVAAVDNISFEHSPSRGSADFTDDKTALDVIVVCTTVYGERGFVAFEVKYSEAMSEPLAAMCPRHEELSISVGLYHSPHAAALTG